MECILCGNSGHTMLECALRSSIVSHARSQHNTVHAPILPRARDPSLFAGETKDDVHAWIEEVKVYLTLSGIDTSRQDAVLRVGQFLGGEASKWNRRRGRSEDSVQNESLLDWFDALHTRFAPSTPARALQLEFLETKQWDYSVEAYVQQFRVKHGDALDAGNPIPDILARDVFCQGLSNQYVAGELNLEISRDLHMGAEVAVLKALQFAREQRLRNRGLVRQNGPYPAASNGPNGDVRTVRKQSVTCFNCNKTGHVSRDCRAPRRLAAAVPLAIQYNAVDTDSESRVGPEADTRPVISTYDRIQMVGGCTNCLVEFSVCGHTRSNCPKIYGGQLN
jgi:hypothetical protein